VNYFRFVFNPIKQLKLYANASTAFRAPNVDDINKVFDSKAGEALITPNPDLKPETSYNAEIGFKQGFKIGEFKGFIDVAVFQQEFRNFIEFTFGQWTAVPLSDLGQISKVIGFKSLNTGGAKVQGAELSIMGTGTIRKTRFDVLAGYTYTKPISTTPDYVYAQTIQTPGTLVIPQFSQASYLTTSENNTSNILKYRMQHLVRIDVGATRGAFNAGLSFRSNSHMQNIDKAFAQLEQELPTQFNPGINSWRSSHTKGDFIFDARVGYTFSEKHKIAFIMNNVLNREYAIRPLAIEEPRLTMVQYTLSL
jgi:iron complex outermembrane receptor protein